MMRRSDRKGRYFFPKTAAPVEILLLLIFLLGGCTGAPVKPDPANSEIEELRTDAQMVKSRIEGLTTQEKETVGTRSLLMLDQILAYMDQVQNDPDRFDSETIMDFNRKIRIVNDNIERFQDPSLQMEISFPRGAYQVSELEAPEMVRFQQIFENILATIMALNQRLPEHPIRITLKSTGYSDELPILSQSLEEMILKKLPVEKRAHSKEGLRKQYNQVLSELRAIAVYDSLRQGLEGMITTKLPIVFDGIVAGLGEALPVPEPEVPYQVIDERRRICRIQAYIEVVP